jgi:hypothetical protein
MPKFPNPIVIGDPHDVRRGLIVLVRGTPHKVHAPQPKIVMRADSQESAATGAQCAIHHTECSAGFVNVERLRGCSSNSRFRRFMTGRREERCSTLLSVPPQLRTGRPSAPTTAMLHAQPRAA